LSSSPASSDRSPSTGGSRAASSPPDTCSCRGEPWLTGVYMSAYDLRSPRVAEDFRAILNLPEGIDPITIVPLGYPGEAPSPKTVRSAAKSFHMKLWPQIDRLSREHRPRLRRRPKHRLALSQRLQFEDRADRDLAFKRHLPECSIREGVRIVELLAYKGVTLHVLDETSWMATGSLKSTDGCLTAAFCRLEGTERIVFESGGNSGTAFTMYGRHAGLETFFFCPLENIDLLNSRCSKARERILSPWPTAIGSRSSPPFSPRRRAAGTSPIDRGDMRRPCSAGCSSWSTSLRCGIRLDLADRERWIRPIGIYRRSSRVPAGDSAIARFLGLQQEANCPLFRAWKPDVADRGEGGRTSCWPG